MIIFVKIFAFCSRTFLSRHAPVRVPGTSGHASPPPQHAAWPEAAMPSCFTGTCATRSPSRKGCHPRVDLGGAHLPQQGILPRAAVDTMVGDLDWSMFNLPDQAQGIAVECVEDPSGSRAWEPGPCPAATCYFISYPQDKKSMYDFIMIHALCSSSASQSPNRRILARGGGGRGGGRHRLTAVVAVPAASALAASSVLLGAQPDLTGQFTADSSSQDAPGPWFLSGGILSTGWPQYAFALPPPERGLYRAMRRWCPDTLLHGRQ